MDTMLVAPVLAAALIATSWYISNVKMSGSGRVGTCDANSGTHKNLWCMSAKSCPFLGTQVASFSCGKGITRRAQNL